MPKDQKNSTKPSPSNTEITESISEDTYNKIVEGINDLTQRDFYLMKDCTLTNISKVIDTNSKYLSLVIRQEKKQSFGEFVNEPRVKYALQKINNDPHFKNYSVTAMALELGYKERKSFNTAFKEFTGLTPSKFIAELKLEEH